MAFDTYLKNVRSEMNVNQTQMAKILDISRTAIKLIENGSTKFPSKKVLHNLSEYLDKSQIEVMSKILFTDIDLDNEPLDEYFMCRYLAHMYLDGWNIDCAPYIYQVTRNYQLEFDGRIIKKRQPKNVIIVTKYDRFLVRLDDVESIDDVQGYMGDMLSIIMAVLDDFRSIHIVFDYNDAQQRQKFECFKNINYRKIGLNIKFLIFDAIQNSVIEEITYK